MRMMPAGARQLLALCTCLFAFVARADSFTPLGDLPGGFFNSDANALAPDAGMVVGAGSITGGYRAFIWTPTGGMIGLSDLVEETDWLDQAEDVTPDGSVVVGQGSIFGEWRSYRATLSGGSVTLFEPLFLGQAAAVSADGSVVVGSGQDAAGSLVGRRWTAATGSIELPLRYAWDVSADGTTIVGRGHAADAVRWSPSEGLVPLGDLPGGTTFSEALGVSRDGQVIVGRSSGASGYEAFRWTASTGMIGLGDLAGGNFSSTAMATTDDGAIIVGASVSDEGSEAFVWSESTGMLRLEDVMANHGIVLNGWRLERATDISPDGRWIVGAGGGPRGGEAWLLETSFAIDYDGDGVENELDPFPADPDEWLDSDDDGIGDNGDPFPFGRFADVTPEHWAFSFIERLFNAGVSAGCGGDSFCPNVPVTRAQMAVFLERSMRGGDYSPPPATGGVFLDVAASDFAAAFIEQLFIDGVTRGCGDNRYCPSDTITRAEMAVLLLRAAHGENYAPAAPSGMFADVAIDHWAAAWIEQLAFDGISSGCGNGNFCPDAPVTRAQMAVFLVRAFGL